jgi:CheY-like chemotaxis protein
MRILIIEDDPIKLKNVSDYLKDAYSKAEILDRMSYQSGLKLILKENFDVILLDMQLPNYDIKPGEDGYRHRPMAGRDILKEIKRKKIPAKVIIITQYDTFGENGKTSSLDEWHTSFIEDFAGIYLKIIFYKPGLTSWKLSLKENLDALK